MLCEPSDRCISLQVVSTVDPFGYYSEGIQQGLDDAFRPRLHTDSLPSPRPATAPRSSISHPPEGPPTGSRPASAPAPQATAPTAAAGALLLWFLMYHPRTKIPTGPVASLIKTHALHTV